MMIDYLRDPEAISRRSFELIKEEVDGAALPADIAPVAYRAVHACGMTDIVDDLAWSEGAGRIACDALASGAPILTDVAMVASGITVSRLPAANRVICTLNDPSVAALAARLKTTRTAAARARPRAAVIRYRPGASRPRDTRPERIPAQTSTS